MSANRIADFAELSRLLEEYSQSKSLTNNYMLRAQLERIVQSGRLSYCCTQNNLALLVEQSAWRRVYYYLNDLTEPLLLTGGTFVLEIVHRAGGFPVAESEYWQRSGWSPHISRALYEAKYEDIELCAGDCGCEVRPATTLGEVEYAVNLFNLTFDPYTGDYIEAAESEVLLAKGVILIALVGGKPRAALHFDTQSGKNVLAHIVVEPELRGLGIARRLVSEFVRVCLNINPRYSLWVRQDNTAAQNLYQKMGFRSTNKYSFSMLKL